MNDTQRLRLISNFISNEETPDWLVLAISGQVHGDDHQETLDALKQAFRYDACEYIEQIKFYGIGIIKPVDRPVINWIREEAITILRLNKYLLNWVVLAISPNDFSKFGYLNARHVLENAFSDNEKLYRKLAIFCHGSGLTSIKSALSKKIIKKLTLQKTIFPFSDKTLKECRQSHVLILDTGISIRKTHGRSPYVFRDPLSALNDVPESCIDKTGPLRWRLVCPSLNDHLRGQTLVEQKKQLDENEMMIDDARFIIQLITGKHVPQNAQIPTLHEVMIGNRCYGDYVTVTNFADGISIGSAHEDVSMPNLMILSERKPDF